MVLLNQRYGVVCVCVSMCLTLTLRGTNDWLGGIGCCSCSNLVDHTASHRFVPIQSSLQDYSLHLARVSTKRDNAITLLGSRLARSVDFEGSETHMLTPEKVATVLLLWRKEQLGNYKKWCVLIIFSFLDGGWIRCFLSLSLSVGGLQSTGLRSTARIRHECMAWLEDHCRV